LSDLDSALEDLVKEDLQGKLQENRKGHEYNKPFTVMKQRYQKEVGVVNEV